MEELHVQIKKVNPEAVLPRYASGGAAGMDLSACLAQPLSIMPGERAMVPTGIALATPRGYCGLVFARSGLATRHGLALANGVGVIDSDYRGEIICAVINLGNTPYTISHGDRMAQILFVPVAVAGLMQVEELELTARGAGGFGSTGQ